MNIEVLQRIILDFQEAELPSLTERDLEITPIANMSFAVVGARRVGKTFRTYQYIRELVARGVMRQNICRIQFHDPRLRALSAAELSLIDTAYFALFPEKRGREEVFFVFDEIHRIEGWEDYVLYLLDDRRNKVLITGSTSKLLKGDIASGLRGKNFSRELLPFSFTEFARHYQVAPDTISTGGVTRLIQLLQQYIRQGGFPGLLDLAPELHRDLLESYWDTMVLRDIIEAHPDDNINIVSFSRFSQALLARTACPVTVNKIIVNLRQDGVRFSAETLYKYMHYLQEAYMLFSVEFFSPSERVRSQNYRKVYSVDWALADAIVPAEGVDPTRQFENLVYLELRRRGYGLSYYRTQQGHEVDFVAVRKRGRSVERELYQVCYTLEDPEVRKRELRALTQSAVHLKATRSRIITFNNEETIDVDGLIVDVVPAWKWLLNSLATTKHPKWLPPK
jgi:predicted AAA+ superfamily ATPase